MESVENQFIEQVESLKKKFAKDDKVNEFEKASDRFDELVEKGVARKRGYNLLSPTDEHIKIKVRFNAK